MRTATAENRAIIVAHGQPSDPSPAEAALAHLAARVAGLLPDWRIKSATLAAPDALRHATRALPGAYIYPMFMSNGWFTNTTLPERLKSAGAATSDILAPFGRDPRLPALAADLAHAAALDASHVAQETTLVLAAHGGAQTPAAARGATEIATKIAREIAWLVPFYDIRLGFLEHPPYLCDTARLAPGSAAVCLPLFAARGDHVRRDVPKALRKAGFRGPLLVPIGHHTSVPQLIAAALEQAAQAGQTALLP